MEVKRTKLDDLYGRFTSLVFLT